MRAVVCSEYGPPEALGFVEVDDPVPGRGEVLVDIVYAAVNYPDVLIIDNKYQVSVPVPFVPGSEFSGFVSSVGEGVDGFAPGDRVFGSTFVGAYAERIAVPADALRPVPDDVPLDAVAGFWVAHATAYHSLRSVAEVQPGEVVLVLGAAGGVGLAAVELAVALGARVIAAASTGDKLALCRQRGAEHAVNYVEEDFRARLRDVAPDGIDVVIDPVGGPLAEQALRALRWRGRFVTVGFASGEIPRIPLNLVLLKGCVVLGFEFRSFLEHSPDLLERDDRELLALLAAGRIAPHVSAVYELADTAAALRHVAARQATGKVLLRARAEP